MFRYQPRAAALAFVVDAAFADQLLFLRGVVRAGQHDHAQPGFAQRPGLQQLAAYGPDQVPRTRVAALPRFDTLLGLVEVQRLLDGLPAVPDGYAHWLSPVSGSASSGS